MKTTKTKQSQVVYPSLKRLMEEQELERVKLSVELLRLEVEERKIHLARQHGVGGEKQSDKVKV